MNLAYYCGILKVLVNQEEVDRLVRMIYKDKRLTEEQRKKLMKSVRARRAQLPDRDTRI